MAEGAADGNGLENSVVRSVESDGEENGTLVIVPTVGNGLLPLRIVANGDMEEGVAVGSMEVRLLFCGLITCVYDGIVEDGSLVCGAPVVGNSVGRLLSLRMDSDEGIVVGSIEFRI